MTATHHRTALAVAAVTSCLVAGWVSLAIALAVDTAGYQFDSLSAGVEIAAAVSLLSVIGGFLPAFTFLWLAFCIARHLRGGGVRFIVAGGIAGLAWLALAWPTRPGSAVWSAIVGLGEAPASLLWLFTGQILFAGASSDGLSVALVAAPILGGAAGGLVYARLLRRNR